MSYRRALSFSENEKELVDYFDTNGKSEIGKQALRFYKDNKDKIVVGSLKEFAEMVKVQDNNVCKPMTQNIPKGFSNLMK